MDPIAALEVFPLHIPRETPYLGPLETDVVVSPHGYFVRPGNQTVYSIHDHSVLVRLTTASGVVGWGESFGVIVPNVAAAIMSELMAPSSSVATRMMWSPLWKTSTTPCACAASSAASTWTPSRASTWRCGTGAAN